MKKIINISILFLFITTLLSSAAYAQRGGRARAATVIFFTGGALDYLSEIGPELHAFARRYSNQITVRGGDQDWAEYRNVCGSIASSPDPGMLILVGHSHGAHAAVAAAQCLHEHGGVRVDLLITLDTIAWLQIEGNPSIIPPNVAVNFNFYQRDSLAFRGRGNNQPFEARSNQRVHNRKLAVPGAFPHSNLDNYALSLVNWIVGQTLSGRLHCVDIPGPDSNPPRLDPLVVAEYQSLEHMQSRFLNRNCR